MLTKGQAEEITQKVLDVMEDETNDMNWVEGISLSLYVASKILLGLLDVAEKKPDPVAALGVMQVKDAIIKKYNSLPSNITKQVVILKKKMEDK